MCILRESIEIGTAMSDIWRKIVRGVVDFTALRGGGAPGGKGGKGFLK